MVIWCGWGPMNARQARQCPSNGTRCSWAGGHGHGLPVSLVAVHTLPDLSLELKVERTDTEAAFLPASQGYDGSVEGFTV